MSEFVNEIKVEAPDGATKYLRVGGSAPVVEYLGGSGTDLSEIIKEVYIYDWTTSPYLEDLKITFITATVVNVTRGDGKGATSSSNNGFYSFAIDSGTLYMYIDNHMYYSGVMGGSVRIIDADKCVNRANSPIISAFLDAKEKYEANAAEIETAQTATEDVNDRTKVLQTITQNKLLNDIMPTMVYKRNSDWIIDYNTKLSDDVTQFKYGYGVTEIMMLDCSGVTSLQEVFGGRSDWGNVHPGKPLKRVSGMYGMDNLVARGFDTVFTCLTNIEEIVFNTSSLGAANGMHATFNGCQNLKVLDMSLLDFSKMAFWSQSFGGCKSLKTLKLPKATINKVNFPQTVFYQCSSLTELDLTNITCKVGTWGYWIFYGCTNLIKLDMSTWDFSNATSNNSKQIFTNCKNLTTFSGFPNMPLSYSLSDCGKLTYESAMNCINGLYDLTQGGTITDYTPQTLSFSTATRALLSDEDIAVATAKGWNIAG